MFIDKRCPNTYAVHRSFQLERRTISVLIFNFLSISPVSQGRLDKENKNGNEAKYIGSSLSFKIDHIRFCTRIEFAVRISYKTRLIVNGDISLIELSLTTMPTGILILKQHDNNVSPDLPHAMVNVCNFFDAKALVVYFRGSFNTGPCTNALSQLGMCPVLVSTCTFHVLCA